MGFGIALFLGQMDSAIRLIKLILFAAVAYMAVSGSSAFATTCEESATSRPELDYFVRTFRAEVASNLGSSQEELSKRGLLPFLLEGRPAPKRLVFFSLNPRRGDLIINLLPDIAAMRKIYPDSEIVLLSPHGNLVQGGLPNFRNVQLKDTPKFARELYDNYKHMNALSLKNTLDWNFQPFLAELKTYLDESTMVVTHSSLRALLVAAREHEYEELRQKGLDLTHFTFFTNFVESKVCGDFEDQLRDVVTQSPSSLIELERWPRTLNLRTEREQLWESLRRGLVRRMPPEAVRGMAYAIPGLMRDVTFGVNKVAIAPPEFFVSKDLSALGRALLQSLPATYVLINMNKGEQRRLNQVETQSAVFLEKILSKLINDYPNKRFVLLDIHESWRTRFERAHRPRGEWMTAVRGNRAHFLSLPAKIGRGRLMIISSPEDLLPAIIQRSEAVITQDSGLSHTAVSILSPEKVLMLSIDDMGRRWAAPNQPTVFNIDSWSRIEPEKLEEIFSLFRKLISLPPDRE